MRLEHLAEAYAQAIELKDSSEQQYDNVVSLLLQFSGPEATTDETFEPDNFLRWTVWLRETPARNTRRARTGRTINGRVALAKTLWQWCHDEGHTPHRVITKRRLRPVSEEREPPTAWSIEEIQRLVACCPYAPRVKGWSVQHWRALLLTFWDTAARLDALLSTHVADFDPREGFLHMRAAEDKEGKGDYKRLRPETTAALTAVIGGAQSGRLFPWPRSVPTMRRHFRKILRAARLPQTHRDLFHKLRRTHATHLAAATDVETARRSLNHARAETTLRAYIDRRFLPVQEAADVLPSIGGIQ